MTAEEDRAAKPHDENLDGLANAIEVTNASLRRRVALVDNTLEIIGDHTQGKE